MCPDACLLGDSRSREVDNQDKPSQKYIQLRNKNKACVELRLHGLKDPSLRLCKKQQLLGLETLQLAEIHKELLGYSFHESSPMLACICGGHF